jgi:hypothetical protein
MLEMQLKFTTMAMAAVPRNPATVRTVAAAIRPCRNSGPFSFAVGWNARFHASLLHHLMTEGRADTMAPEEFFVRVMCAARWLW